MCVLCVCVCVCVKVCVLYKCTTVLCEESIKSIYLGLARTIYTRCTYRFLCRKTIKFMVIYGIYIYGSCQPYKCLVCTHTLQCFF